MLESCIDFLGRLRVNNNKTWFDAHKSEYLACKAEFETFGAKLIEELGKIDSSVAGLTVKDCTYRFYRDIRFSADKSPYKTHFGLFVAPNGKKSGYGGYYFHIEPAGADYIGGNLICAGNYRPAPMVVKSIREEILDNGEAFAAAIAKADSFTVDESNSLRRAPSDFPADSPYERYFRLRDFTLNHFVDYDWLYAPDLLERTLAEFRKTKDFLAIINRATRYAFEEMM